MIYNILFAVCGIGLIALGLSLFKLDDRVDVWSSVMRNHEKLFTDIDVHRTTDLLELDKALERIKALEDRLEGQEAFTANLEERLEAHAAELTEHHNKIDTLEINGSVYESLFEQQGLWGESKEEKYE